MERHGIYKGLEQPLSYKGLKGKYIGWGIGSLAAGLFFGGLIGAMFNMYLGIFFSVVIGGGFFGYTLKKQKDGLHQKRKMKGVFIYQNKLKR